MDKTAKDRMKRYRNKKRNESPNSVTVDVTQYPAILYALVDPVKRKKLEDIYLSLKAFRQEQNVYLGCGKQSMPFDMVGEYLEATRGQQQRS